MGKQIVNDFDHTVGNKRFTRFMGDTWNVAVDGEIVLTAHADDVAKEHPEFNQVRNKREVINVTRKRSPVRRAKA